jgi:hypothetical protein
VLLPKEASIYIRKEKKDMTMIVGGIAVLFLYVIFSGLLIGIPAFLIIVGYKFIAYKNISNFNSVTGLEFGFSKDKNKIPKNVPYFRDIPCGKDIFRAYAISSIYKINKNKMDFLGSVLLKWIKQGNASIGRRPKGTYGRETYYIILNDKKAFENSNELALYEILYEASKDGIIEPYEMRKYCKKNHKKVIECYDNIIKNEVEKLKLERKVE